MHEWFFVFSNLIELDCKALACSEVGSRSCLSNTISLAVM